MPPMPEGVDRKASSRGCTSCGRRRSARARLTAGPPVRQRADPAAGAAGPGAAGRAVRRRRRRLERDQLQGAAPRRPGGGALEHAASDGAAAARATCEQVLGERAEGVFLAASDYMRLVPEMIARWVPGGLFPLGTDGFGRSETRAALRRFFEVDRRVHHRRRPASTVAKGRNQTRRGAARDQAAWHRSGEGQSYEGVRPPISMA